jgi:hypothetical protein
MLGRGKYTISASAHPCDSPKNESRVVLSTCDAFIAMMETTYLWDLTILLEREFPMTGGI